LVRMAEYHKVNREKIATQSAEYYRANREKIAGRRAESNANRKKGAR
jgi:hypothetical protein